MKNEYYEYLRALSKEELLRLVYKPTLKAKRIQHSSTRLIALMISYNGKNYKGLSEFKYENTIGNCIKNALMLFRTLEWEDYVCRKN